MIHETNKKNEFTVTPLQDFNLAEITRRYIADTELSQSIMSADVVILPHENFRDVQQPLFPEGTMALFYQLQKLNKDNVKVEICIEDDDFKELVLHDDTINLPVLLLSGVSFPTVMIFIKHYIDKYILEPNKTRRVKAAIIKRNKNEYIKYEFEGDAQVFKDTIDTILKEGDNAKSK